MDTFPFSWRLPWRPSSRVPVTPLLTARRAVEGMLMEVHAPNGQLMQVQAPTGAVPGMQFMAQY